MSDWSFDHLDTRSYRSHGGGSRRRKSRRGFKALLLLAALCAIWVWWTTRDLYTVEQFIPKEAAFHACFPDFLERRAAIADSKVWELGANDARIAPVRAMLANDFGQAEWLVNNVFQGPAHLFGSDLQEFGDTVLVTRMSRIGAIIEKAHTFYPGIDSVRTESGRRLRLNVAQHLYYTVCGRVLLVSKSQEALENALTLGPERRAEDIPDENENTDLWGYLDCARMQPLGGYFQGARFSARWLPKALRFSWTGTLQPAWQERLNLIASNTAPASLPVPADGMVAISGNLGKNLDALWTGLGTISGQQAAFDRVAETAFSYFQSEPEWTALAQDLAQNLGPVFTLSWSAIDQNALLPMPELLATFAVPEGKQEVWFGDVSTRNNELPPDASVPRFDEKHRLIWLPLPGGAPLEPALAPHGEQVIFATNRVEAVRLLSAPAEVKALPLQANLYVRLQPYEVAKSLSDAALQFAELGLLRGYTADTFKQAVAPWLDHTNKVHDVAAYFTVEDGRLSMEMEIEMTQ